MKKRTLLSTFTFLFIANVFSQKEVKDTITSARITYTVEKIMPPDIMQRTFPTENIREKMIGSLLKTKAVTAILEFDENKSLYKVKDDEFEKSRKNSSIKGINFSLAEAGFKSKYYTNYKTNEIFYQVNNRRKGRMELVYYEVPNWEKTSDTLNILGYKCFKAIEINKGKKASLIYTAWYTNEISFSYGPKRFMGLPGLVLKVEQGNTTIITTKIELNFKDFKIIKPTEGFKTSFLEKFGRPY